ncbi:MAG: hemerythrin domain-containing protein [Endomicrobiales bacterium]
MDVVEQFIAGHREIAERNDILKKLVSMADNDAFFWDNALKLSGFFKKEVREHFRMEEKVLFPVLRKALPEEKRGALDRIEKDHAPLLKKLSEFEALSSGHLRYPSKATREELARTAGALLDALLKHAREEDVELFPFMRGEFKSEHYKELEELYFKFSGG